MTTAPEKRTATLTELVAQEIDAARGRRRMSQAQLAREMGKTPMWVSLRLRGLQPIDLNDLLLFGRALGVEVHDLMPSRDEAAKAVTDRAIGGWPTLAERPSRPADNRPPSRPAAHATGRTGYLPRRRRDR